jgi:hypothetical protein
LWQGLAGLLRLVSADPHVPDRRIHVRFLLQGQMMGGPMGGMGPGMMGMAPGMMGPGMGPGMMGPGMGGPPMGGPGGTGSSGRRLFVSNLSFDTEWRALKVCRAGLTCCAAWLCARADSWGVSARRRG